MRAAGLILLGLAAMAAAGTVTDIDRNTDMTTMDIKTKQMWILKLLNHIMQPCMYKEIVDIGKNFKIEDCTDCYVKTEVVKKFIDCMKVGMLPRGEIFTLHVDRQMKEVVKAFHLLYFAKDFTTFLKTACWMRLYLNEGMFVYALTVACRHREDCRGIILPPPYEIYPYYFVRADVIQKAYKLKMKRGILDAKLCEFYGIKKTDKDVYVIDENIYDKRVYLNYDDKLRYFTEDIDLNTYYYYFHADYPFWMRDDIFRNDFTKIRRGEICLYMMQQLLARHYLERLSNGLGEITTLSWNKPIKKGFVPWMTLHNGVQIPMRWNNHVIVRDDNVDIITLVETCEKIIKEAIFKGYIEINGIRLELNKPEDVEHLGRLIFGKLEKTDLDKTRYDAYRYLLIIMKSVIGLNTFKSDKYFVMPTLLDSYQTALRDPVFWRLQKRIVDFLILFKRRLPCYTREELHFPGVKIDNIVVDKLVTYFDDFMMDMTNAVMLSDEELKKTKTDMKFLVRKRRLNHQPFKVTFEVLSDKTTDCIVRIFLGPKKDVYGRLIDINRNRLNFVELDTFVYKLNTGKNVIVRDSMDMHNLVRDRVFTHDWWKKLDTVGDIHQLYIRDLKNYNTGFPTRLLLPKGHVGGMEFMLYCIVSPLRIVENVDQTLIRDTTRKDFLVQYRSTVLLDKMALGYPLDRHIDVARFFTPNMKIVEVKIFHKKMVCDMKTRWEKYVLKNYNYNFFDKMHMDVDHTYSDFVEVDTDINRSDRIRDDSMERL
ncbi:Basic juvenile hormone-suppressible protein 2 [Plutella xylostella]|uniref:Basic juvenile hormone-suppressible protein 2 n=1 Tax=Plutella xylostella TaxID=51655 RepID=A0ABQ7R4W1_PLUXY|nr:Basic juvenile hormone-suppressible protein 2 [Plutella xylostella]